MPNIRIMNWNIERLSWDKAQVPGVLNAIAGTVVSQQIDILVIVEVRITNVIQTMEALCTAMNGLAPGTGNDYKTWCLSYATGMEYYGFIIRDLNRIRPVQVASGPTGASNDRITTLYANTFTTWGGTFAATQNAYAALQGNGPWRGPDLPIVQLYSGPAASRRKRPRFSGDTLSQGGYSLGVGFRAPCMAMFQVKQTNATAATLLPMVVCHYMAAHGPAGGQMQQLKDLHVCQHFNNGEYINLDAAPVRIQELMFTGDFNVDFLNVDPNGTRAQQIDANAYQLLTSTMPGGGSATAGAIPGPAQPVPGTQGGMPFPFQQPYPPYESTDLIPGMNLRIAATTEMTHYKPLNSSTPPTSLATMRDHCYDNFIYGGTQLGGGSVQIPCPVVGPAPPTPPPAGDSELTVDLANNIRLNADPALVNNPGLFSVKGMAQHYSPLQKKGAHNQPNLQADYQAPPNGPVVLGVNDKWVGARMVSDHLPTVVQVNLA